MKYTLATVLLLCTKIALSQPITAILGAFDKEVKLLQDSLQNREELTFKGLRFMTGYLNGHRVVVAETGIGKTNAAMTTALVIERFEPQRVIFTGIAGAVGEGLEPSDIVIAEGTAYHDYHSMTFTQQPTQQTLNPITKQLNPTVYPADAQLLSAAMQASGSVPLLKMCNECPPPKVVKGLVVTGDLFVQDPKKVKQLRSEFGALATEMEGAAVAQVSHQLGVPCLIIRSLSDKADKHARRTMLNFATVAATNSANLVRGILRVLKP